MSTRGDQFVGLGCGRCKKKYRGRGDWNAGFSEGVVVAMRTLGFDLPGETAVGEEQRSTDNS